MGDAAENGKRCTEEPQRTKKKEKVLGKNQGQIEPSRGFPVSQLTRTFNKYIVPNEGACACTAPGRPGRRRQTAGLLGARRFSGE